MKKTTATLIRSLLVGAWMVLQTTHLSAQVPGIIRCYTDQSDSILRANHPEMESNATFEDWIQDEIEFAQHSKVIGGVYQIPVVVHVIYNGEAVGTGSNVSYAAIQSQIAVLNEDFRRIYGSNGYNTNVAGADTKIEFCLSKRRPDGSAFPNGEDGVNRINRTTAGFSAPPYSQNYAENTIKAYTYNNGTATATRGWVPSKYMNIWLCALGDDLLGYAQFPQSPLGGMGCSTPVQGTDGVVFLYSSIGKSSVTGFPAPYNEGRTATHEIGHWLGLRHIWGDGNCSATDYCNDTPPALTANFGCPLGLNSCTAAPDQGPDMIENYMDYTDDLCMNTFTNDQKQRMRAVLEGSPLRLSLINSDACTPPNPSDASITDVFAPVGDNCVGAIIPSVQLKNRGGTNLTSAKISYRIDGGTATLFNWTGTLTPNSTATVALPAFTTTLGIHYFEAYSTLPNGITDPYALYDTSAVTFVVSAGITSGYTEDFESGNFPTDSRWTIVNGGADCYKWSPATGMSISGVLSNNIAEVPCYGNGATSNEDLWTPIFLLPCNATAATLKFDVAYRRKAAGSSDQLIVQISTDCGTTWTNVYSKTGNVSPFLYQNATVFANEYFPAAATDWRTETINLMSYVTTATDNIRFRFRGVSANGNNIFIDNVKFNATTPGEIQLLQGTTEVLDEGYYTFPTTIATTANTQTFTINNTGTTNLVITPPLTVTGTGFTVGTTFGATTIPAGGSTTFTLTFTPTGAGPYTGNVSFATNDCDEGTYNFVLNGTGVVTPPVADFSAAPRTVCQGGTVAFTNLSTNAAGYSWSFGASATPSVSTAVNPSVVFNTAGTYPVTLTATSPYGSDVETKTAYITVINTTATALPLTEGFATAGIPAGWTIVNNNSSAITWAQTTLAGNTPSPGNSLMFDNFDINDGDDDEARIKPLIFTGYSAAQMTFDVAYRLDSDNPGYPDGLRVLVTTDCGGTYTSVYAKSGSVLSTVAAPTAGIFIPTAGQWRTETINLSQFVGQPNVTIIFKNLSGYGNRLFIDNVNITGTVTPTANYTAVPNPACVGQTVTYTSTSTAATSYSWNFGTGATPSTATTAGPHTVTYSSAGTKTVTLQINGTGPTSSQSVVVNANPTTPVITPGGATTFCSGGSVTLSAPASTNYLWSTGATTQTITVTTSGSYTVQVFNASGCSATSAATVVTVNPVPSVPTITAGGSTTFCSGGSVVLTSSAGSGNTWSNGATTPSITVTTAGIYTVTAASGGCTSSASAGTTVTVNTTPATPTITAGGSTTFCAGGSVVLTSSAGSGNTWSNGSTTPSITVTTSGTYTVTATATGCTSPASAGTAVTVNALPTTPTITAGGPLTFCAGGSVVLTSSAGSGNTWSNGATTASITVTTSGTYTVTRTVTGCTSPASIGTTVTVNPIPTTPTITAGGSTTFCSGGSVVLTSSAGSGNTWSTGSTTPSITVTTSGTYTVTATATGCTSPASAGTTVTVNPTPATPTISAGGPLTFCSGGSVVLTSSAGSGNTWSNGATTPSITVTTSGIYTVTTTTGSCTSPASAVTTVTVNPIPTTPTINAGSSTTFCSGGSVVLTSSAGLGNTWSTGEVTPSITVTTTGTYSVTATATGCTSPASAGTTVTVNPTPSIPTITAGGSTTFCSGGSVVLTSSSGSGNTWSTGETTPSIIVTISGTYTVTTAAGSCTSTASSGTTVTVNPTPATPTITAGGSTTFCSGNSVVLTSSAGSGNTWSTGETTPSITVSTSGTYTVTTTTGSCTSAASAGTTVTVNPTPVIAFGTVVNPATCAGTDGSIQITGSGSGNLTWSGTASGSMNGISLPQTISGLSTGTYVFNFVSSAGCSSNTLNQSLVGPSTPAAPIITAGGPTAFCPGGSVTLTSSAGTNYLWSTGETTPSIVVSTAGSITVQITNASGCISPTSAATATTINSVPTTPVITAGGATTFCAGENVTLSSSGSNSTWSSGENTNSIVVSTNGSYTVTETNGSGCTATSDPIVITVNAIPAAPVITPGGPTTFCAGGSVNLTSSSSTGNTWSTAENTPSISVSTSGTVTLTVTANGCTSAPASQSITVNNNPVVSMSTLNGVCTYTPAFVLTGGSPAGGAYTGNGVSSGNFNPGAAGLGTTTIAYTFTDGNGCMDSAAAPIVVDGCAGLDEHSASISLYPNPTNGLLHIESTEPIKNVMVYDQLGKLVFKQTTLNKESVEIDLSAVATGVYTIHVTSAGGTTIENIVIQK